MNWTSTKLGLEPKRISILAVLVAVAGYFFISNSNSGGGSGSAARPAPPTASPVPATAPKTAIRSVARSSMRVTQGGLKNSPREFRPSVKVKEIDPSGVDPTLHLNLLAKLQDVKVEAGTRSLFEISAAPPPETKLKEPEKIKPVYIAWDRPQKPKPPEPKVTPPDPAAPPIPLKFYGWVNREKAGPKRAFFLKNDEIIIATEGDLIDKRYKVVRIGVNSALVEDTQFKRNSQQQLPLEAELPG